METAEAEGSASDGREPERAGNAGWELGASPSGQRGLQLMSGSWGTHKGPEALHEQFHFYHFHLICTSQLREGRVERGVTLPSPIYLFYYQTTLSQS